MYRRRCAPVYVPRPLASGFSTGGTFIFFLQAITVGTTPPRSFCTLPRVWAAVCVLLVVLRPRERGRVSSGGYTTAATLATPAPTAHHDAEPARHARSRAPRAGRRRAAPASAAAGAGCGLLPPRGRQAALGPRQPRVPGGGGRDDPVAGLEAGRRRQRRAASRRLRQGQGHLAHARPGGARRRIRARCDTRRSGGLLSCQRGHAGGGGRALRGRPRWQAPGPRRQRTTSRRRAAAASAGRGRALHAGRVAGVPSAAQRRPARAPTARVLPSRRCGRYRPGRGGGGAAVSVAAGVGKGTAAHGRVAGRRRRPRTRPAPGRALKLFWCRLDAASMPALTRLLGRGGGLVALQIFNGDNALPPSPAFCAALRASKLQRLVFSAVRLFENPDAGIALLGAATGHPSLQLLDVGVNHVSTRSRAAVGAALGALVASNTPSLTSLHVWACWLLDAGLAPLVATLAGNTALRSLDIRTNGITRLLGVALLAAVGANTGLRNLEANRGWGEESPEIHEAKALVAARA